MAAGAAGLWPMIQKKGTIASPGVAIGPALVLDTEEYRIPRRTIDATRVPAQIHILDDALKASREEVRELRLATARQLGDKIATIFALHEEIIADKKLRDVVVGNIENNRYTAAYAFGLQMNELQRRFRNVADPYLKERVRDLFDIEKRVMRHILGRAREDITRLTEPVVIVAHDITPSQAVSLDQEHVLGFAINVGGSTSHTAILARMLGKPAVVALNDITSDVAGGEPVIIDGTHGIVVVNPDPETIERYQAQQAKDRASEIELRELRELPAVTQDGHTITLLANIELSNEARSAMDSGAEGIGLYRTEFLFLSGERPPNEEDQYEAFRTAVRHAGTKPITIRTMDLGADKMMSAMGAHHDHNPVLGLRSLRYCLKNLGMFRTHLRAILRASAHGDVRIMFPMVTNLMELRQAKSTVFDVMEDLEEDEIAFRRDLPIGMMVETPAAAMLASIFVKEVAFFSLGTNDLTQYTLAVDRANERVSDLYAPHNPAVIRLIRQVIRTGRRADVTVNLCGEMAGAPIYTMLLLGLGLRQLSMAPKDIPEVKKIIRLVTLRKCETVVQKVLRFDDDRQILNYLRDRLRDIDPDAI